MSEHENDIIRTRCAKLARLRERGNAFPNDFRRSALARELHARHGDDDKQTLEEKRVHASVCGRVMLRRDMGKASFFTLQDVSGRIQCYVRRDEIGESGFDDFKELWDLGDLVGVEGHLMRTNKGELTVAAERVAMLTKCLRPLPEKYHGLADTETRYRQRYLDLIMSEESRHTFETRTRIIAAMRRFFEERRFLEVETPMMQAIPGGATARPFVTHHNALDMDLYLRVAPELNLKRLVVGGFERVFEINRNFRNEGLSPIHNPEFTMLEFYQAYADYRELMQLTRELLHSVTESVLGTSVVTFQGETIDFGGEFPEMTMAEAICAFTDIGSDEVRNADALRQRLLGMNLAVGEDWGLGRLQNELFEARVEDRLTQPIFITRYPKEISPLARSSDDDPEETDRFELFVAGREIANGFSELNDAEDQTERFRAQAARKDSGDHEAMPYDADYITALEHGLPPTAGEGIGIDRLVMLLTDSPTIRDVLLFPHMRPRDG